MKAEIEEWRWYHWSILAYAISASLAGCAIALILVRSWLFGADDNKELPVHTGTKGYGAARTNESEMSQVSVDHF